MTKKQPEKPAKQKPRQSSKASRTKSQTTITDELAAKVTKKFEKISDELDAMPF